MLIFIDFPKQLILSGFNDLYVYKYHIIGNSCCNNQIHNPCFNNMLVLMARWIILVAILWWIILVAAGKYVFPQPQLIKAVATYRLAPSNMCTNLFLSLGDNCFRITEIPQLFKTIAIYRLVLLNMCTQLFSSQGNFQKEIQNFKEE